MTTPMIGVCRNCARLLGLVGPPEAIAVICEAFPRGAPEEIPAGRNDHSKSIGGEPTFKVKTDKVEEARRLDDTYKPEYFEKWMDWDRHVRAWAVMKPFLRGQSFLDVGCGMGFALKQLQSSGYVVRGTEVSPWAIGFCAGLGIPVDKAGATKLPYEDDSFDTVFSMFLLDEVPKKAIAESIRVAKMRAVHLVPDGEKWEEGRLMDGFRVMVHDKEKVEEGSE